MRKAISLFLLLISSPAIASFYSGNELFSFCTANRSVVAGFVAGAYDKTEIDAVAYWDFVFENVDFSKASQKTTDSVGANISKISSFCIPNDAILNQAVDVFCQYLAANPKSRHETGASLLNQAFTAAWPCGK